MRHHSPPLARVKIIHNVAKGPVVDVLVDNKIALSNVSYKTQSDYLQLPAGIHQLAIVVGGNILAFKNVSLSPNTDYTVIAHGDVNNLSSLALLVLQDNNNCPAANKAHVRFVHAAAGAPAVDIWAGTGTRIFKNVSYGNTGVNNGSSYLPVDAGNVDISVTPANSTTRVLGPLTLNLEAGKVYTITASGIVGNTEAPLTALFHEDRTCTVHRMHNQIHNMFVF